MICYIKCKRARFWGVGIESNVTWMHQKVWYARVRTHTHITYTHACVYIYMFVCTYIYIYTHSTHRQKESTFKSETFPGETGMLAPRAGICLLSCWGWLPLRTAVSPWWNLRMCSASFSRPMRAHSSLVSTECQLREAVPISTDSAGVRPLSPGPWAAPMFTLNLRLLSFQWLALLPVVLIEKRGWGG